MTQSTATDILIDAVADRFANTSPTYGVPQNMRLGTGSQTPSAGATSLTTPVPLTYDVVDNCDATTGWSASTDGSVALNTTDGEFIEGVGCLNLVKSGTTATNVTYSKTTTSQDYTSKTLWTWLYVTSLTDFATTACVEIRFGSDNSNYYYKRWDKADLSAGANWLHFTSAEATGTTGSPSITACDYYAIKITLTATSGTYTGTSVRLDHLQVADTADTTATFYTGPTVNAATDVITSVVRVSLIEAVGQPLTNSAWYLSTGEMYGIDQATADTKNQEEEFEYTDGVQFVQMT